MSQNTSSEVAVDFEIFLCTALDSPQWSGPRNLPVFQPPKLGGILVVQYVGDVVDTSSFYMMSIALDSTNRKEYTIIGDVVNMASRLEQATKEFQARLLISEGVRGSLDAAMSDIENLGPVELKGQPNPARIFKVA